MERPISVQREAEEIMERTGRYIPPYKLSCMVQTSAKVLKIITSESFAASYEDCRFILTLVERSLDFATEKEA